jgi:hypothetical protein
MDAYFIDGAIDSVRARGSAECVYYIQDEDSAFTGINQSNAELMDVYFKEKEIQRVVFRTAVKGTIWPMKQKTPRKCIFKISDGGMLKDPRPSMSCLSDPVASSSLQLAMLTDYDSCYRLQLTTAN